MVRGPGFGRLQGVDHSLLMVAVAEKIGGATGAGDVSCGVWLLGMRLVILEHKPKTI